jgi:hypothetical protein
MDRHPPELSLAYVIASGGEKTIPILLTKLHKERDEWMQNAFIYVFLIMSRHGDLRGRHDVADQLKQIVSHMRTPQIREEAQEAITEIDNNVNK